MRRTFVVLAAGAVALALVLVALLHTPVARSRIFAWVTGMLDRSYGLVLTADTFRYNLFTGGATLTNVRLAAKGHEARPFFTAARVDADLPLAAYAGSLVLDDVVVEGGRVEMLTDADGVSNMPGGGADEPPPATPRSLALRGLHLTGFAFLYDDQSSPLRIAAEGIDAALGRGDRRMVGEISGPLAVRGGVDVQLGERALRVDPIDSRIAFDGSAVSIQELPLSLHLSRGLSSLSALGTLSVAGRVTRVLDAPALELTFDGQVDTASAATWAPPPMPVAGVARVKGSVTGAAGSPETVVRVDAEALSVGAERDLTASVELVVDTARVTGNRVIASPASGGQVDAAFDVPFDEEPLTANATWQGVDARVFMRLADVESRPIGARLDGQARFQSGPDRLLDVRADLDAIRERGVTPLDGRIEMAVRGERWTLQHVVTTAGISASGTAEGRLDADAVMNSTLAGPVKVTISSLGEAGDSLAPHGIALPDAVRGITGAIDADVTLAGTLAAPSATIETRAPELALPGIGPAAVTATIDADPSRVVVAPLRLARGGTEATGEVTIDLERRALAGALHAQVPDARELQDAMPEEWRASGALAAEAVIGGTFDAPRVDVTITSPGLEVAGETLESLDGRARITENGVEVSSLSVRQGAGAVRASGRYGFDRAYALDLEVADLVWSRALVGEAETTAFVNGRFTGTGTVDRPQGSGQFRFMLAGGVAGDLIGTGTVDVALNGDHGRVAALVPSLGAFAHGTIALAAPYDYRAVAVLNRVDLATASPLIGAAPGALTGQVSLTAAAHGAVAGNAAPPNVAANIQAIDALVAGVPLTLTTPAAITWQPGDLVVRDFTARLGSGTLSASGERTGRDNTVFNASFRGELSEAMTAARAFGFETDIAASGPLALDLYATGRPGDLIASVDLAGGRVEFGPAAVLSDLDVNANLTGEALTLYALSAQVAAGKASGRFAAKGNATIPGLDPMRAAGAFVVDTAAFDTAGIDVTQARPSTISISNGIVHMDDVVWQAAGSRMALGGSVDLTKDEAAVDLSVTGVAVLRVLSAFVPTMAFDGTADVDVRVQGTAANPVLTGRMQLNDAEMALSSPRLVVSELSGPIALAGDRIELRGLTGTANGGTLVTDGGVVLKGTEIADAEIAVQIAGMAVEYPRGLRSEIDALVTYSIEEAGPQVVGDVRVLRSSYTAPISLAALATATTTRTPAARSALDDIRLNVAVTTVEDMRVDNNYGRFEGGAQVRLVGTVGEPGLTGRATLREGGTVYAAGRTFTITRGNISFTNLERIEPDLDIQAQTRVSGQGEVTLTVQGTPQQMSVDLSSSEQGSREEIATALFGGGVTTGNAFTLLSGELLGVTGQRLGLDALRLDVGGSPDEFREDPGQLQQDLDDPVTRLTLSKRIRDNVEFTVSQNLRENGRATFVVSYFPIGNFEVRAVSRDNSSFGLGLRHQVTFGGTGVARPEVVRAEVRVARVEFEGELAPFTESGLREMIRVRAGEAFSFYDWQRDLDRLTAAYVDGGYFEARVRGRRVDLPDGSIAVVYAVSRGPATRIVVEGAPIPDGEIEAITEAWTRAVFDRFLVQDAENRLRRYLLASGYVDGHVRGSVEVAGDTKTLQLTITRGARAERRGFRFRGNDEVSSSELEAVLVQSGLELEAWIDPDAAARALSDFYRDEGFLRARVEVPAGPEESRPGELTFEIVEGPRAAVGEVHLEGVSDAERPYVERAIDIAPGEPYTAIGLDAARDRVARHYRQHGFNNVQVTAAATPAPDDTSVSLAFTVAEGPRQVLREVVTTGATRTREGIVDRALRLRVGEPVNLEEWSMARKRLFDTNVFRAVDIQAVPLGEPEGGEQDVRAVVTVEEYPHWRLRYGVQGVRERTDPLEGEEEGRLSTRFGAIAELRNQNLFGRAVTAGVAGLVEKDFQRGNVFLSNASFFGLPVRSTVSGYLSREDVQYPSAPLYVTDDVGISFEQRWRRRRGLEVTYGYRFRRNHTYEANPDPQDFEPFNQVLNLGKLTSAALFDRRDDPVNSQRGTFSSVSYEHSASALGADVSFGRVLAQQYLFVPLGRIVLASRVVAGRAFGDDDPPLSDRFYAGGGNSVRGYKEDGLGPEDIFLRLPVGGTRLLVLNQEVRFPIYRWVRGVGFLDAGKVVFPGAPGSDSDLKVGYGAGLRIDSPVGLLRLDFGIPGSTLSTSSRRANAFGSGRWYFGIGHIF
ncbi:MAG: translocation/assembly module TamB domain-containing protein [Vicinamibacterales bacterium]